VVKLKIWRVLTLALLFLLLAMAAPAAEVLAAESMSLSPNKGKVGDTVTIECTRFKRTPVKVYFYLSSQKADVGDRIGVDIQVYKMVGDRVVKYDRTISNARFDMPVTLTDGNYDEDVVPGYYYVYAVYETTVESNVPGTDIVAVAEFIVIGIALNKSSGTAGSEVKIDGFGFSGPQNIVVKYDDAAVDLISGYTQTDKSGDFLGTTIIIPQSTAGDHTIEVEVGTDSASTTFIVKPAITVSASSGAPGDSITVSGSGFGDEMRASITFGNTTAATATTDASGSFSNTVTVPDLPAGTVSLEVKDADNNEAKTDFNVGIATAISISPSISQTSPGHVGMDVTIRGTGFKPNAIITITYTAVAVATTASDANGNFTATFKVPKSEAAPHTIFASDGTTSKALTFYMEATPPAASTPLLPEADSWVAAQPLFDWQDVTDSSGVTYALQIAVDANFTTAALVLDKKGLTNSEYNPTVGEKLPKSEKDSPYYWRVKAIDGASNESDWSAPEAFYVGSAFQLPSWAVWVLVGVGGVGLFVLGYWLGRRSAYSVF
jgi:hypothetical protein